MMTIKKCVCKHAYQDEKYGQGNRVVNELKTSGYRCTVCGKDIVVPVTAKKVVTSK